ncbi:putative dehydrogenase [Kribbella steppae]|uniref:Putative dehydrogenase n=1 Tax=Kribbella steppae TaxID=2512223 RepID=A0A4R2HJK0_9ACTN|nr:Gfo/Idh/MocA family oxidoreductase [Kribbella steppae]TCO30209.1 putative dehydrogenase [Kribbella steppae]
MTDVPRVAVAGVHGHGASHVRNVARLAEAGRARLVAVADPRPAEDLPADVQVYGGLDELLASTEVDVVIISTPIQTHVPLAELSMRAGADVLLEKPPTASLAEFEQLSAVVAETGRACQVGFQAQASTATLTLAKLIADGRLGEIRGISAVGKWVRKAQYFQRARWAGRRTLDGVAVVDGAVTNPLAHSTAAALLLDGSPGADDVRSVETELFRANPIESDDTSTVRIVTGRGTTILIAVTLCAAEHLEPQVIVHGSTGRAVLKYATDTLELHDGSGVTVTTYARDDLLENLLAHRADPAVPLYCPLTATGGFTKVVEAVRVAEAPAEIPAGLVRWEGDGLERHPIVVDVEKWIDRASDELALFSELGAPWTIIQSKRESS